MKVIEYGKHVRVAADIAALLFKQYRTKSELQEITGSNCDTILKHLRALIGEGIVESKGYRRKSPQSKKGAELFGFVASPREKAMANAVWQHAELTPEECDRLQKAVSERVGVCCLAWNTVDPHVLMKAVVELAHSLKILGHIENVHKEHEHESSGSNRKLEAVDL